MSLALLFAAAAWADPVVFVPLDGWLPRPELDERAPVAWTMDSREIVVEPGDDVGLEARWTLRAVEPGWVDVPLIEAGVSLARVSVNGRAASLEPGSDGMQHLVLYLEDEARVALSGSVAGASAALALRLAPAIRQRTTVRGVMWDATVDGAVRIPSREAVFLGGPEALALSWRPAGPPPERPPLLRAEVATATTLDAGGLVASSKVRYRVARGQFSELRFRLPVVEGLEVSGDGLVGFRRDGDEIVVALSRPVEDRAELEIRYRAPPMGEADRAMPTPWPIAAETTGWLTVLRADESLVAPSPGPGAEATVARAIPAWAGGLSEGTPIARYRLSGRAPEVRARVVAWEPIDGPPTLVDEARYEVAFAEHGRLLLRARYQVRNDRRQFLRLAVPDGLQLIAVTVSGRVVQPALDAQGRLLVPLEKSVETLEGLVSFPVDISFWGSEAAWDKAGLRELRTPTVDAPVAYARWELVLPPGVVAREVESRATEVEAWSNAADGLRYGHAYGQELGADEDAERVQTGGGITDDRQDLSQAAWNEAYSAYKANRFEESKELIDRSLALDPNNKAARQLQSNLEVLVGGEAAGPSDSAEARRVREFARARTVDAELEQQQLQEEADEAVRAGDYEVAQQKLEKLVEVSGMLAAVEQAEAVDKKTAVTSTASQLSEVMVSAERKRKGSFTVPSKPAKASGSGAQLDTRNPPTGRGATRAPAQPPVSRSPATAEPEALDIAPELDQGLDEIPIQDGYATVILGDPQAAWDLESGLVIETDIYALLTAEDLVFTGEEGLHTEVVIRGFGASGSGSGGYGSGHGEGIGVSRDAMQVSATLPGVHIPRAGQVLRFEARLLQEGEPLVAELRYRTARETRHR